MSVLFDHTLQLLIGLVYCRLIGKENNLNGVIESLIHILPHCSPPQETEEEAQTDAGKGDLRFAAGEMKQRNKRRNDDLLLSERRHRPLSL